MNKEAGFTFVEMLLSLTILLITIPLVVYFLSYLQVEEENDLSVEQFFVFIRNDVISAHKVTVEGNRLYFQLNNNETAKLEHYNQVIRRQVGRQGHEIYLRDVVSFRLEKLREGVKVFVETVEGETYEKTIHLY